MQYKFSLSIIIINWNASSYLRNCLDSIYSILQDISFEIIVIDNASTENIIDIKHEFPQVRFVENSLNVGFSQANNQGASLAAGEVLLFLNPDTIVKKNSINLLYDCIILNGYTAAGPKLIGKDNKIQIVCARSFFSLWGTFCNLFLLERLFPKSRLFGKNLLSYWDHKNSRQIDCISGACIMIKSSVFQHIGGFDTNYLFYSEDVDLCYQIKRLGKQMYYCAEAEVIHYGGASTKQSSMKSVIYEVILFSSNRQFFRKNFCYFHFLIFNLMAIVASIFRILLILIVGIFVKFNKDTEFNLDLIQKYRLILQVSIGQLTNEGLLALFKNAKQKNKKLQYS